MKDQVVITGTGLVSSLAPTASGTWDELISENNGIRPIENFNATGFECRVAALVHGLGAEVLNVHPRDARIMDRHAYMLLKASRDAFTQASLAGSIPPEDIGYFAAMGMVDYNIEDLLPSVLKSLDDQGGLDYDKFFSGAYRETHPLWPLSMLNNINFCQVAIDLGINGENTTFAAHSDSAIHSIIEAYNAVLEQKSGVVLAGGVSEKVSPSSLARASLTGILNNDDATCRPFGKNRNGTILGEGSGIITVELRSSADQRQVPCLAAITGYGSSFEADGETHSPTARAVSLSMEAALGKAELAPQDIDLIIAHGDGTPAGDLHEAEAIHHTFAKCVERLNVFSSKSTLGHLLSGASATDTILGTYILKHGIIPAVYGSYTIDERIKFNVVKDAPFKADPKRILINSQSYEGQCASLIIESVN